MKILLINKFLFPKGGDTAVFFETAGLLKQNNHKIIFWGMDHPQNIISPEFSSYLVSYLDLNSNNTIEKLRSAIRVIYSFEARKQIKKLLVSIKPDIVHMHNIHHQISPSIIDELKKNKIPIVMTLHDYKLTCPYFYHLDFIKNKICEKCAHGRYYNVLLNRCTKKSYLKSALNMVEMYLHHKILKIYKKVDIFISPSKFLKNKIKELGFMGEIVHLPNFIDSSKYEPFFDFTGNYILYFGRLSKEKGLVTLVEAMKELPNIKLKLVGEGPLRDKIIEKIRGFENIEISEFMTGEELKNEIINSMLVVIPSEWYENNPRSVIEAFALGKPVIGARIGGIPELVRDSETGLTFEPGNHEDLRDKIEYLVGNKDKIIEMGKNARNFVETELNPEKHYEKLMEIYRQAIDKRSRK